MPCRHQHDNRLGPLLVHGVRQGNPIHPRHLVVGEEKVDRIGRKDRQGGVAVGYDRDNMGTAPRDHESQYLSEIIVVIYYHGANRHADPLPL